MVNIFRFCYVIIPLAFSLVTLVLTALAIAGSTKNNSAVNQIYLLKLNLTDINIDTVVSGASEIASAAGVDTSSVAEQYGLSDIYTFGLWGYCKGSSDGDNYDVSSCSDPKALYEFDPLSALQSDLNSTDITLPDDVTSYVSTAKIVTKLIFITSIIGVGLSALTAITTFVSLCSRGFSCCSIILGILTFLSLLIASGASTGTFLIVKKYFNNAAEDFGITSTLSNYRFYAFMWAATGVSLITLFFNLFALCCSSDRRSKRRVEEEPFMAYEEKSLVSSDDGHHHH